ncbi:hypothetical protein GYMLUDRAFT_98837 [Collybiopsis luxurians FD-317 M1]|uniref:Uncharacterized protein n=1 Tax=Collybiopsis luxurians FD-317 M1 TaxID=944289 RepID=A0A0D0BQ38_9AGAR|nr:hypothetical protein GYMLUDRAFT_98837 [Collybiopsis luxurians FD-317 M1]
MFASRAFPTKSYSSSTSDYSIIICCFLMFQQEFALPSHPMAKVGAPLWSMPGSNIQLYGSVIHLLKVGKDEFQ